MFRSAFAGVVVSFMLGTAWAESVPEFNLGAAKEKATEIVVVDETGLVLEAWKGTLKPGAQLQYKASAKPISVVPIPKLPEEFASKVGSVTGKRRVLFLIRTGGGRGIERGPISYAPASFMSADIFNATVWIEKDECFANYQWMNPGDGAFMHSLHMSEKRLKDYVTAKEPPAR